MDFDKQRARMVERQLRRRGIADERVLAAMGDGSRGSSSCPKASRTHAYRDGALAIGHDQTISQPWIVAAICEALALAGTESVLEIGTGSGYSAAVLSLLAREVDDGRARARAGGGGARASWRSLGIRNVEVVEARWQRRPARPRAFGGDRGSRHGAGAPRAACSRSWRRARRMVVPIALDNVDMLTVFQRPRDGGDVVARRRSLRARFVPLLGSEGFLIA